MNFDKVFLAFTFSIALSLASFFFPHSLPPLLLQTPNPNMQASLSTRRVTLQVRSIERRTILSWRVPRFFPLDRRSISNVPNERKKTLLFNPEPPPSLHKLFQVRASSSSTSSKAAAAPDPTTTSRRNALSSLLLGAAAVGASVLSASPPPASAAVGGVGRTGELAKGRDARKAAMKAKAEAIREKKVGYSQ